MKADVKILALSSDGLPTGWMTLEKAILLRFLDKTIDIGEEYFSLSGGINASSGKQTIISTSSIIMLKGRSKKKRKYRQVGLENQQLFRRDANTCAYCSNTFSDKELTRDHVNPRANKGLDSWDNVVTACKPCNHRKDDIKPGDPRFPKLHFLPYKPCLMEYWILLRGKNILPDQFKYLRSQITNKDSRIDKMIE